MTAPKKYFSKKNRLKSYFIGILFRQNAVHYLLLVNLLLTITLYFGSIGAAAGTEAGPVRILAFGDSLTAGYGLAQDDSFPAQLQRALRRQGYNVEIINAGVSGDTSTGGRARLDWALGDNPHAVILALGANDGLRAIDPALTQDNLSRILAALRDRQLPVLLVGMLAPPNLGDIYADEFNAIYPDLAKQYDVDLYPFFLEGVALIPELNQADGIHPNEQGVAVIVERMLPFVIRLIEVVKS